VTVYGWLYRGRTYRQWLDARWAAFFDALGLAYSYEVGGLELGCGRWIPSGFWLPGVKRQVEGREWPGRRVPADFWPDHPAWAGDDIAVDGPAARLVVIYGPPGYRARPQAAEYLGYCIANAWDPADDFLNSAYIVGDSLYVWTECPACGKVGIEFEGRAGRLCDCFPGNDRVHNNLSPRLVRAYAAASAAPAVPRRLWHGLLRPGLDRGLMRV
jgi:hypothetical protein